MLKNWIRRLLGIDQLDLDMALALHRIAYAEQALAQAQRIIGDGTEAHLDVPLHPAQRYTVVLIGRYKNAELVEIIDVPSKAFEDVVQFVRRLRVRVGYVDTPLNMRSLSELIRRETKF